MSYRRPGCDWPRTSTACMTPRESGHGLPLPLGVSAYAPYASWLASFPTSSRPSRPTETSRPWIASACWRNGTRNLVGVCAPARPSPDASPNGHSRTSGQLRADRRRARHADRKHQSDSCAGSRALEARAPAQLPGRRPGRLTVEASAAGGVTASDVVADRTPLALWRVDDKGEGARAELRTAVVASSTTDLEPRSANRSFSFGVAPPACSPWYVTCVGPSAVIVPRTVTDPAARQSTRPDNGRMVAPAMRTSTSDGAGHAELGDSSTGALNRLGTGAQTPPNRAESGLSPLFLAFAE